ncbi:transglycosylase SLT domain-containing protein [Asticcacaulis solisilvae]|uniref:transglycosylase SLT domain-containing protein n=1 Tax=Asticcacaulis solisilvae TaxID=1217274 RepID=UPI003FD6D148
MPTSVTSPQSLINGIGQTAETVAHGVMGSLQRAASATGVDFSYLVKTAQRESSLNPNARARTSSAAGLFQFVEQTWLGVLKTNGAKHGYGAYADQITKGRDGRYRVTDPGVRHQVMGLRFNPDANAVMAAEMTAGHAAYLKGRIGRDPTQGELYAAHFLGADGAADLITANASRPGARAASLFPAAAHANPTIFYKHGKALDVASVVSNLTHTGGDAPMPIAPAEPDDAVTADTGLGTNPMIVARLDKLKADQAIMQLVFGDNGGDSSGLLFATQLMSAFGPEGDDDESSRLASLNKAFGGTGNMMG